MSTTNSFLHEYMRLRNEQVVLAKEALQVVAEMHRHQAQAIKQLERADRLRGESESFEDAVQDVFGALDADDAAQEASREDRPRKLVNLDSARAKLFKASGIPYGDRLTRVEGAIDQFLETYNLFIGCGNRITQIVEQLTSIGEEANIALTAAESSLGFPESDSVLHDYVADHPHLDFVYAAPEDVVTEDVVLVQVNADKGVQEILEYVQEILEGE